MDVIDVFISYRRSDGMELAQKLYHYLHDKKGLRVFLDKEEMIGGQYFDEQIRQKVIDAPNYIFIGTPDAFAFRTGETDYVAEEIRLAIKQHDENPERVVLPVLPVGNDFPDRSVFPEGTEKLSMIHARNITVPEPTEAELLIILKDITKVNKHSLWNAGHRWLENSKEEGARFAALHIDEVIMPNAKNTGRYKEEQPAEFPINVYQKKQDNEGHTSASDEQGLLDALSSIDGHLYLIGQGGIGKTTALISIMNKAYENRKYTPDAQVPLFIELSRAPDTNDKRAKLYTNGKSTFIRRAIYQQIRQDRSLKQITDRNTGELDEAFTLDSDTAVNPVTDILTMKTPAPEYILLLDGLNETSRTRIEQAGNNAVVSMIVSEIQWIIDNCPNVRVILTSRTDEAAITGDNLTHLYLKGVDDNTIRGYLESRHLPGKLIDAAFSDRNLIETIRVPLFLTMYASLKNNEEVSTQGEIFRMFFSERSENIDVYTAKGRINAVQEDVESAASESNPKRITAMMQSFFLDFIIPEIAWSMERAGKFYIDEEDIAEIIEPLLSGSSDTDVCGRHGKKLFDNYRRGFMSNTRTTADSIISLGSGGTQAVEYIIDCIVHSMCVMQENGGEYGFMHHHIRDYFAAVRNINSMRLGVYAFEQNKTDDALTCLAVFVDKPISAEVRRFMGEYLQEHRNAPLLVDGKWKYNVPAMPEDRNLVKRALDIFRGRFDGVDGPAVYNLVEILKTVRKDLRGADLSGLDLSKVHLGGYKLSDGALAASFKGAKVTNETVFPTEHSAMITTAEFFPDSKRILTASKDGTVKVWEARTFELIRTIDLGVPYGSDVEAYVSPDGRYILTRGNNTVSIWDGETYEHAKDLEIELDENARINSAQFSPGGKYIILAINYKSIVAENGVVYAQKFKRRSPELSIYYTDDLILYNTIEVSGEIELLTCSNDERYIAFSCKDGRHSNVGIYSISDRCIVHTFDYSTSNRKASCKGLLFSPDSKQLLSAWESGSIYVCVLQCLETKTFTPISAIDKVLLSTARPVYSPDGKQLAVCIIDTADKKFNYSIRVYDSTDFSIIKEITEIRKTSQHKEKKPNSFNYSNDGIQFFSLYEDILHLRDVNDYSVLSAILLDKNTLTHSAFFIGVFSPDNRLMMIKEADTIIVIDIERSTLISNISIKQTSMDSISFKPDGTSFIMNTGSQAKLFNTEKLKLLNKSDFESKHVFPANYIDNSCAYATIHNRRYSECVFLDANTLDIIPQTEELLESLLLMNFVDVEGNTIYSDFIEEDITIGIYENILIRRNKKRILIYDIKSLKDPFVLYICDDNDSRVIDRVITNHNLSAMMVEIISKEEESDTETQLWRIDKQTKHADKLDVLIFSDVFDISPDGQHIVYSYDGSVSGAAIPRSKSISNVEIISAKDNTVIKDNTINYLVEKILYSPDGHSILCFAYRPDDNEGKSLIILLNANDLSDKGMIEPGEEGFDTAQFTPDGKYILTATESGFIQLWDPETLKEVYSLQNIPDMYVQGCDFSDLHDDSLSEKDKKTLYQYGAII